MLTEDQLHCWTENGFLRLSQFLSPAGTHDLLHWVEEVASWASETDRGLHHLEQTTTGPRLARSEYFAGAHEGMSRLLTEGIIPETGGVLLGEPVVLYKEKINYKYPGGGGYAPHQDAPAYDHVNNHITCLIAVDESTPENGCLFFASGLHRQGLLPMNEARCLDSTFAESLKWDPAPLQPGDALFFSSYAPHYSPPNHTEKPRRSLYLTYNARSEGDLREAYYRDKRQAFAQSDQHSREKVAISLIGHFQGKPVEETES